MTQNQLIDMLALDSDLPKCKIELIIQNFKSIVIEMAVKEPVKLRGLGAFYMRKNKPRKRYNPNTKECFIEPASKTLAFRRSKK